MLRRLAFLAVGFIFLFSSAEAADLPHLVFVKDDWELSCDNTRTCRVAGYHADSDELPVSVLLTRKAGPHQPVTGQVMLGAYDSDDVMKKLPSVFKLLMMIDGQKVGEDSFSKETFVADLPSAHVAALIRALRRNSSIEWVGNGGKWKLSAEGAFAVLLAVDQFQHRVGTPGAFIEKGERDENEVLPPLKPPVVVAAPLAAQLPRDKEMTETTAKALREALYATDENCEGPMDGARDSSRLSLVRLTKTKLLASMLCWSAAYNEGYGYWVINDEPPFEPVLVTLSGSDYGDGIIYSAQKGRGIGDCWSSDKWTWDGTAFVHTEASTTGLCKVLAPGGAWHLPTLVTDVRRL